MNRECNEEPGYISLAISLGMLVGLCVGNQINFPSLGFGLGTISGVAAGAIMKKSRRKK